MRKESLVGFAGQTRVLVSIDPSEPVIQFEAKYNSPNTPQGEIKELGYRLAEARNFLKIAECEELDNIKSNKE